MKIISANEICNYIQDGDTIYWTGMTLGGFPEQAASEIEKSFLERNKPRDLTLYWEGAVGNRGERGLNMMAHEGLVKRAVGSHLLGCGPDWGKLAANNAAEIYCMPLGVTATIPRHISSRRPGVITKVGMGTFMDPRHGGGAMDQCAAEGENLIELIEIHGEEWLLYKLPKINVTLIRGTYADENGNITMDREAYKFEQNMAAAAAKTCGGIVICQVERIVSAGTLSPMDVIVPGIMVDYVYVADPQWHWQTAQTVYNPVFSGDIKIPLNDLPMEVLSPRKVIARRAAMELIPGDIVNLGVGIPEAVASVAAEEKVLNDLILTTEAGAIGGMPANKHDFGCSWNAQAMIIMENQLDYYDGNNIDFTCVGCLEVDKKGNINASMLKGHGIGVGGFMNVTASSKKVVFAVIFAGGLEATIKDGSIKIDKEGYIRKFPEEVEQITFNGELALKDNKEVLVVTERAVFRLTREGWELIEIAPGIDLEKDVLNQMDFKPIVKDVKLMPKEIFQESWNGLETIMNEKKATRSYS